MVMVELIFATKRLYARKWNALMDADTALAIYGDEEVVEFIASMSPVKDLHGAGFWAVELQKDNEVVGGIELKPLPDAQGNATKDMEISWEFRKDAWGNGYATEIATGAIAYAFRELGLREVNAVMNPGNTRSIRVAERLGMQPVGLTDEYYDMEMLLYRIYQEDWGAKF
jgi:RimJ/RimL family protein N-acetyltransferase